jgi:hypothetical protein
MVGGSTARNTPSGRVIFLDLFRKEITGFQEKSVRGLIRKQSG